MDPATFSAAKAALQSAGSGGFFAGFGATAAAGSSAVAATAAASSAAVGTFCGVSAVVLAPVVSVALIAAGAFASWQLVEGKLLQDLGRHRWTEPSSQARSMLAIRKTIGKRRRKAAILARHKVVFSEDSEDAAEGAQGGFPNYTLGTKRGSGTFGQVFAATIHHPKRLSGRSCCHQVCSLPSILPSGHARGSGDDRNPRATSSDAWRLLPAPPVCLMEHCDGGDLSIRSFSESAAAGLARQLFMALAFLHHLQWVHQDVKPANLYLKNNCLRLGDFGAAVRFGQRSSPAGSFHYMAPEIFKEEAATAKADTRSAAMTSFCLVTGRVLLGSHPRDARREKAMFCLDEIRERCPPSWPSHPLLSSFMAGVMQIEPDLRPTSLEVMRQEWLQCQLAWDGRDAMATWHFNAVIPSLKH